MRLFCQSGLISPRQAFFGLLLVLVAGCASDRPKKAPSAVFYPPPPAPPRVQSLTSFSTEAELGGRGGFVEFVVGKEEGRKGIQKPYGLALSQDRIYICDTDLAAVEIIDLTKRRLRYFVPRGEGQLPQPINIAVDKDGTFYVTDTKRNQVLIYGKDENYLGAIGEGDELKPVDVAVAGDRLYVLDMKGRTVRVLNKADRKLLFTVPREGGGGEGVLFTPTNLALDSQGRIYVSDTGGFCIQVYDAEGRHLRRIGQQGLGPGTFARPKGVAVDREGRIYVADAATEVVQILDGEGRPLMFFGDPGQVSHSGLNLPAKVVLDYDHLKYFQRHVAPNFELEYLIFVSNQFRGQAITVFGFGHKK